MPSDPEVPIMGMDEAIQSVLVLNPEELLPKTTIQALTLLTVAAAQPNAVPREQLAMVAQWALWTRAQDMLLNLVLNRRMTVFPQPDGTMKFGGALMKVDEAAAKVANIEAAKILREKGPLPAPAVDPTPTPKVLPTIKVEAPQENSVAYEKYTAHLSVCDGCTEDELCPVGKNLKAAWLETRRT